MSDDIKDLDALVPSDKKVSLGGRLYTVPGDIPMEVFVRVNKAGLLEDEDEAAAIQEMVGALVDLFSWNAIGKPSEDDTRASVEKTLRRLGVGTISKMLHAIYSEPIEEVEPDAVPPVGAGTTTPSS